MFTQKINYIWTINLLLFIGVVILGIEQAGRGADISNLENNLVKISVQRQELTENIFRSGNSSNINNTQDLGFIKPSQVVYFNSIDSVASTR